MHGIDAAGEVVVRPRLSRGRILAFFETASLFPLRCPWRGSPRPRNAARTACWRLGTAALLLRHRRREEGKVALTHPPKA